MHYELLNYVISWRVFAGAEEVLYVAVHNVSVYYSLKVHAVTDGL